jgi:Transport protein particle (TRAPP) component
MIVENNSVVNKYISVSKDLGSLNCAAYAAGIVHGILDSAQFVCVSVFLSLCSLCSAFSEVVGERVRARERTRERVFMYIYIYIYMCVCVCMCALLPLISLSLSLSLFLTSFVSRRYGVATAESNRALCKPRCT